MKVLCCVKNQEESYASDFAVCFTSPKKIRKNMKRHIEDIIDLKNEDVYEVIIDYKTIMGLKLKKGDKVIKCIEHTFGLIKYGEISITIPIIIPPESNNKPPYSLFIGIPSNILK
tara:strand:- start:821 stop:1165 length:345 start_codon:yes stop_codon:yes gene_type:complete